MNRQTGALSKTIDRGSRGIATVVNASGLDLSLLSRLDLSLHFVARLDWELRIHLQHSIEVALKIN